MKMSIVETAFIDCDIWEIKQWPRFGVKHNIYLINDIYYYNSLTSDLENKKQSVFIQLPDFLLQSENDKKIVKDNIDRIISENIPIVELVDNENWIVNLTFFRGESGNV